jgi:hypothetical protein
MPRVGKVVAYSLLSNMPELGFITNKQAAIACVRKMIVILNTMVRDGVYWEPKMS